MADILRPVAACIQSSMNDSCVILMLSLDFFGVEEVCPLDIAASVLLSFPSDSFNVFIENLVHARAVISVSNMGKDSNCYPAAGRSAPSWVLLALF